MESLIMEFIYLDGLFTNGIYQLIELLGLWYYFRLAAIFVILYGQLIIQLEN